MTRYSRHLLGPYLCRGVRPLPFAPPRGISLLEVLVTIAAVIIVSALVMTAVGYAKHAARQTSTLSDLRSGAQALHGWSADNNDFFLHAAINPQYISSQCGTIPSGPICVPWEQTHRLWRTLYYWSVGEAPGVPRFEYSFTLVSSPTLWTERPSPLERGYAAIDFFRPVRMSETAFASHKGMLLDEHADGSALLAFVDGSARKIVAEHRGPQVSSTMWMPQNTVAGRATLDGVTGRDVR